MNKLTSVRNMARTVMVLALMVGIPGLLSAQPGHMVNCSAQTLRGSYGFHFTGSAIGPNGAAPLAAIGVQTFDGSGKFTAVETISFGGQIGRGQSFSGTYTVNADCTGSMTAKFPNGFSGILDFVIVDEAKEILGIEADDGTAFSGVFKRV